ncbi:MAG TPA: peptidoglycan-binding domain-containing protein [Acidimicrobiales bacterium]|nr:peptidoglycan-binding domain-containing protein [Acidimicrobiales bacterium]
MRLKRCLLVLTIVGGAVTGLALGPAASPAGAAPAAHAAPSAPVDATAGLEPCGGAYKFSGTMAPIGSVYIPVMYHGWPDGMNCFMSLGAHNWGVYFLQVTLQNCYGQTIAADARFGEATRFALRNAQRIHGITADGVYGPTTRRTIRWWTWNAGQGRYTCNAFTW